MKKVLFLLLLLLPLSTVAGTDCVVVKYLDGKQIVIPMADAAEISFRGGAMLIGSREFDMNQLSRYEFSDTESAGIDEIEGDINGYIIDQTGRITLPDDVDPQNVHIYTLGGFDCPIRIQGQTVDFTTLEASIYLVKIGGNSFKLLKRL